MTKGKKIGLIVLAIYFLTIFVVVLVFGFKRQDNEEFQPQNEFQLDTWVNLPGPLDINKGVMYVVIAGILTVGTMVWVARRMQQRPNRVQTLVETIYAFVRDDITGGSMDSAMARKWFPFLCTLFLFIWFSNLIGYIPLPTNTHEKVDIGGLEVPAFAIYAATANISVPLVLALIVFVSYTVEGVRAKGTSATSRAWSRRAWGVSARYRCSSSSWSRTSCGCSRSPSDSSPTSSPAT